MTTFTSLSPRTRRLATAFISVLFLLPTAGASVAMAWEEESLTEGWFLEWPALAVDSDDHTNVVYMRQGSDPGLFLSTNATGSFVTERLTSGDHWAPDVVLDAADGMHVAYVAFGDDSGIHYLTNESASWVDTRLTTGSEDGDPAIALDSNGKVHIAYAASGVDPGVFYLTNASGDWVRTRLVSAAHDVSPDIAIDGSGRPHIIFARFAPEAPGLYYLTRTGSTWSSAARLTSSYDDWPALALDADGAAHIAFQRFGTLPSDGNRGQLFIATNETGAWVFERMSGLNPGFTIGPPAVAFDANDVFNVVLRESNPGLGGGVLRHYAGSIGAWTIIEDLPLYESGATFEFPTMGFTSAGQLRVGYRSYGGQWAGILLSTLSSSERIDASRADEGPSIDAESDGTRHVAFDRANATGFDNGVHYGDDAGGWDFSRVQWGPSSSDVISGTTDLKLAPDGSARIGIREPNGDIVTNQDGPWERPGLCCSATGAALAVDSNGKSHMALTSSGGSIAYATDSSGTWETTDIHPDFAPEASDPAIAVDGAGRRHVLYAGLATTSTPGIVYISAAAGGAWSAATRLYSGDMGSPDAVADTANKVHVAWIDHGSSPGIYYATNASGAWVRTRLSRSAADGPPTIAVDPNGKILVAYARGYWAATPGLYLATNRTGSWSVTLISDDNFAGDPSLDVGSDGLADIAYASDVAGVRVLAETSGLASQVVASAKSKAEAQGYLHVLAAGDESAGPADPRTAPTRSGTTTSSTDGVGTKSGGGGFGR